MGRKFWNNAKEKRNAELFDKYVPSSGKAETLGGEILRAWNRVGYRYINDGDICGVGYGRETVNPSARWLASKVEGLDKLKRMASEEYEDMEPSITNEDYEDILYDVQEKVIGFLDRNPSLFNESNTADSLQNMHEDWDEELPEDEDEW